MGHQIIKQPDGRLAVFSGFTDTFVLMDATPTEVVDWFGESAAEAERERTRTVLGHVLADNPRAAYFQFARTWEEACQLNQDHGGDLTYTEGQTDRPRATLDLEAFRKAVEEQRPMIFQNAAHTQYKVTIPCPECQQTTRWVEEEKGRLFRMQPCGHEVYGKAGQIVVDDNGYLRVQEDPGA